MGKVITRFPPSPTGTLHMGSARTALFNFLFAKHFGGKMLLRMEDTDKERSKKEYEEDIIEGLRWLGIDWEGEIWRQSERSEIYKKYLKKLLDKDLAYEAEENKERTAKVIRFRNPGGTVAFQDSLRGEIKVDVSDLGDFVIARSIDEPLYHLTVVVDDAESGVTDILRGEDGLANTPRQTLLQKALGLKEPNYTHIPFILGQDKTKLSKRHGANSVLQYRDMGYLPSAILNFLAMLGWRSKRDDEKEIWTLQELIDDFSLEGLQKSPAIFNEEKLRWINKEHLKDLTDDDFYEAILDFASDDLKERLIQENVKKALLHDLKERLYVYSDLQELEKEGEFNWLLNNDLSLNVEDLIWKKSDRQDTIKHLKNLIEILCDPKMGEFSKERVEELIEPYTQKEGKGNVLWPMRYALSAQKRSPSPYILAAALGQEQSCMRLKKALDILS